MNIVIENLNKSYNDKCVINNLSAEFRDGQFNYIMGESGGGKTTLLNIIMGLEKLDSGKIEGVRNRKISAVFQEDRLCEEFNSVVNVRLVTDKDSKTIINALKAVGLANDLNKPVANLSGGMRRRVAIVRAMLADFEIVILDEPLKGLDEDTRNNVIDYIKLNTKGKLVIMVTHDQDETSFSKGNILRM